MLEAEVALSHGLHCPLSGEAQVPGSFICHLTLQFSCSLDALASAQGHFIPAPIRQEGPW